MVGCGFKNEHQKDTCLNLIGLHIQNMLIIRGVAVNMVSWGGGVYDHLLSTRVLGYDEFHYEANGHNLDMLITLH